MSDISSMTSSIYCRYILKQIDKSIDYVFFSDRLNTSGKTSIEKTWIEKDFFLFLIDDTINNSIGTEHFFINRDTIFVMELAFEMIFCLGESRGRRSKL